MITQVLELLLAGDITLEQRDGDRTGVEGGV